MTETADSPEELDGVAIIGMAGRFPGAEDPEQLWRNLCAGRDSISTFSDDELRAAGVPEDQLADPRYVKRWGRIADADCFDDGFFGLSARDAELMDPQHRLFLESAWAALESAGYAAARRRCRIGVYGGVGFNHYFARNLATKPASASATEHYRYFFGNDKDFVCTRVAHALDLNGPALTLQTACSTSLVAVCTAALHLLTHQCDLALAGGASVRVPLVAGFLYEEGGTSSPDGFCRSFDAAAAGAVWGSGVGVVALKRLADAMADGDHIFAVLKGFAVNNDGAAKAGFTAPSVTGQAEVVARALAMAGCAARTIGYVEAHGTATPLGDPIEVAALTQAFRQSDGGAEHGYCALGSVKTNLGHLDVAAGVTGLIKAAIAVERGEIPASLHFVRPSPHIDFAGSPFLVNAAHRTWPATPGPRRAGVSSFGIGGTNAHVIVEQAPARPASKHSAAPVLLPLSAKTPAALDRLTQKLAVWLTEHPHVNLGDVAHTLQVGREAFGARRFVVCATAQEAAHALPEAAAGVVAAPPQVALVGAAVRTQARTAWQQLGVRASASPPPNAIVVDVDPTVASRQAVLQTVGRLWQAGLPIEWSALSAGEQRTKVPLPTYPFARDRHWIDRSGALTGHALHRITWEPRALAAQPVAAVGVVTTDGELGEALRRDAVAPVIRVWRPRGDATATLTTALAELQLLLADGLPRDVLWVTERAQEVVAGDVAQPELAALWGLMRSLAREYPPLRLRLVDVDELSFPLALPSGEEQLVARRHGRFLVPKLVRARCEAPRRLPAAEGAVLITGGLGALGLHVAEHLVRVHGVRRLVLASRRPPGPLQQARVDALAGAGAVVTVAQVDVADREGLARLLLAQPLRGVVHAAGILDDGIVQRLTPERVQRVLAPKVLGARWLDELTSAAPLDFFVLFSSVSSLGAPGQASYAAANAFLDALAQARVARGLPAVSIGWGPWAGDGMAASRNPTDGGLRPITPQEGLALFDAALAQPAAVVYVARERAELPHAQATPPPLPADTGPPNLPMLIRTEVARLLGVAPEALPLDKSLAELGFDSLLGVELRDVLSRRLSIHVPGSLLLDQPNIAALAATLAQRVQREPQPAGAPLGITRLHPESPYPPLYMVGGAVGGDELYLRALAEALGPLQSCHCLHYPGLLAEEEPLDEVTALAKLFVSRLQAFQPSGPYALAGHSLGGIIAFEMAILLTRAGQSVVELILLDAPLLSGADGGASLLPSSLREYLETLKRTNWVTPELAEVFDKGLASSRGPLLERLWRANVTAMRNYRPTSMYHGDATFITPASPRHGLADYISAWKAVCPALKVGRTSGTHITMVRAPHATKTARIIRGLFADPDEPDYQ